LWAKSIVIKEPLDRHVLFHTYWKFQDGYSDELPLPNHLTFILNSYLATQDLNHTSLIFWSNYDVATHKILSKYFALPCVTQRKYDAFEMAKGTVLEGHSMLLSQEDERVWPDGDLMRLLVLHKFGGVYFDADTLLLRDFTPLLNQQFDYYWGSDFRGVNNMNGAIMHAYSMLWWLVLGKSTLW